jgi:hypothetical protein
MSANISLLYSLKGLGLLIRHGPINGPEVFGGFIFDFISHLVDISSLSVVVCQSAEHGELSLFFLFFIFVILNFLCNLV